MSFKFRTADLRKCNKEIFIFLEPNNSTLMRLSLRLPREGRFGVALLYSSFKFGYQLCISWHRLLRRNPFIVLNIWQQLLWPKPQRGFYETLLLFNSWRHYFASCNCVYIKHVRHSEINQLLPICPHPFLAVYIHRSYSQQ